VDSLLLQYGAGKLETSVKYKQSRSRAKRADIEQAVSFLLANGYYKAIAYDVHSVKNSTDEKIVLPNYIRIFTKIKIFKDYSHSLLSKTLDDD
jgi:hypothetical protein